jgi:hypothetical protein
MVACLHNGHGPAIINAGQTIYIAPGDCDIELFDANEALVQIPYDTAGVSSLMTVMVPAASGIAGTSTVNSRVGGANGQQTVSIASGQSGNFTDATHIDNLSAGNLFNFQVVGGAGGTNFSIYSLGHIFSATTNTMYKHVNLTGSSSSSNGFAIYYLGIGGADPLADQTETNGPQWKNKNAGTWKNMAVYISANTLNITQTAIGRQNAASSALSISISPNATGLFKDTSHSVTLAVDDLLCYSYNMGGTGNAGSTTVEYLCSEQILTTNTFPVKAQRTSTGGALTPRIQYTGVEGAIGFNQPESTYQMITNLNGTLSNMQGQLYVTSTTATWVFRKNGVTGNQTISAAANGYFEDTTHNDTIAGSDLLDNQITLTLAGDVSHVDYIGYVMTPTTTLAIPAGFISSFPDFLRMVRANPMEYFFWDPNTPTATPPTAIQPGAFTTAIARIIQMVGY